MPPLCVGVTMPYIESHQELSAHPKTKRAARLLGVGIPATLGHLHMLWHWCLDYAQEGDLTQHDPADIADAVMWDGDPDKLLRALVDCRIGNGIGFLEQTDDGRLLVHDWHEYGGKYIEKRKKDAARKRDGRAAESVGTSNIRPADVQRTARVEEIREEESREENNTPLPPMGDDLREESPAASTYSSAFEQFWERYPRHTDKKQAYAVWQRIRPSPALIETIIMAIEHQKRGRQWQQGVIPHPTTWLRRSRWEDEIEPQLAPITALPRFPSQADLNRGGTGKVVL